MKIFLIDDHAILLDGLVGLLEKENDLEIVGWALNAEDALVFLKKNKIDVLITDFNLPGMDGLELIRAVKQIHPGIKIIMLSMHKEVHLVKSILKEGVSGYVLKKDSHLELLTAIETIRNNEIYISRDLNKILISGVTDHNEHSLSDREKEILKLITADLSNKEIAAKLHISQRTVETHRKNLLRKTGSNSVVGLINYAHAHNLI